MRTDGETAQAPSGIGARGGAPPGPVPPAPTLPKGGGAIRGIGEKFVADAATGTGSMTVPIATSPGRSGFGPRLSLTYDSGTGNDVFGVGWALSAPSITRKTEKGLPQYLDGQESDVFVLSGAEDLVPVLDADGTRFVDSTGVPGFVVHLYRPRVEGLFARIERWTGADGEVHWRSFTPDNVLTLYGTRAGSRIADPADERRVFSWLICETRDDKGNAVIYDYAAEDGAGVDLTQAHQRNRGRADDPARSANRHLKRIRYGNRVPLLDESGCRPALLPPARLEAADWMFEVVLDYDEGHVTDAVVDATGRRFVTATPEPSTAWRHRDDAFSSYRAGFEVRTARLCHRVLVFHHFPDDPDVGRGCLVRSTDFTYGPEPDPTGSRGSTYTFLRAVSQSGYTRTGQEYLKRSLPPLEFSYTARTVDDTVEVVDPGSVENLPVGPQDGAGHTTYRWVDLHGEGTAGVLLEQGGAWFYKRNLSPVAPSPSGGRDPVRARLGPLETVARKPAVGLLDGAELMDLAGDGLPDVLVMEGPAPGRYAHDDDEGWRPFRPFASRLVRDPGDRNARFVDLDGDGRADLLITEDDGFVWHACLADDGFGPAARVPHAPDEEHGPRVVFADGTQSVHLADLSGDALADIVRIRNGEVCYWPNLGRGRFGAKVTMDDAPWFDEPGRFDPRRLRLTDIDGTGPTDLLYLHPDGVRLYFNESGNGWSEPHVLTGLPAVDDPDTITAFDLLGDGTTCLVWSSPLPGDAHRPLRYVRLMGDGKPHLLVAAVNNLGAETRIRYAPSTRFSQQDRLDGRPWITKLPFPVHVVARVETYDRVSGSRFVSRYAYHHGYFDGDEREFRGFALVDQWDTEEIGTVPGDNSGSGDADLDAVSSVPPVHTRTWFHTGMYRGRGRVSDHFARGPARADRYYREPGWDDADADRHLLPDTVLPAGLTADEEREACRALKGAMLRQEVYGLDGTPAAAHPYLVTEQNLGVALLQPRMGNRHGVFLTHARESIGYHYEREPDDPRVSHAMTLEVDAFGNVRRSLTAGYGRRTGRSPLRDDDRAKQEQPLVTYVELDFTDDDTTGGSGPSGGYRTPLPCETRTYQVTGLPVVAGAVRLSLDDLAADGFAALAGLPAVPYEQPADPATPARRLIERARTHYRRDDLTGLLPRGRHGSLGLPGESYTLAFTPGLLERVHRRGGEPLLPVPADVLGGQGADRGGYVDLDGDGHWWLPSGRVFYSPGVTDDAGAELAVARRNFFLVNRHSDPFGRPTVVSYDRDEARPQSNHNLLRVRTEDALGNVVTVRNDYRVLEPREVTDPNGNRSAVAFDALGLVAGTAVMGKAPPGPSEGDSLDGFTADLSPQAVTAYVTAADPRPLAVEHLGTATTRIVYDLDHVPACTAAILRETHVSDLEPGAASRMQVSFSYSDGFGREIQKKAQAEPGPVPRRGADGRIVVGADGHPETVDGGDAPRWVGSGWTVNDNKGRPVRRFEPFFSDTHALDADLRIGVSPWLFYDPIGRLVATLRPDHAFEKVVFDPWQQATYDVNDTVVGADGSTDARDDPDVGGFLARLPAGERSPSWYERRIALADGDPDRVAAEKAAVHRQTPTVAHLDVLARPHLAIAANRFLRDGVEVEQSHPERVEWDIEGNQRAVRDAAVDGDDRGRLVVRYDYDLLGNRIHQAGMETGERWTLGDVAGKPIRIWDGRGVDKRITYDELRRPTGLFVTEEGAERLAERTVYGESVGSARNHRTRVHRTYDVAGVVTNAGFDFRGNLEESTRDLLPDYRRDVDWRTDPAADDGSYRTTTRHDAMNRPRTVTTPDGSVHRPTFNAANLLQAVDLAIRGAQQDGAAVWTRLVTAVEYDAAGRRTRIVHGNGASTAYTYDPATFRLTRLRTTRPALPDGAVSALFVDPGVVVDLHHTYDAAGNVVRIDDQALATVFFDNQQVRPTSTYTYDATYRLVEATGREHVGQTTLAAVPAGGTRRDHDLAGLADLLAHPNDLTALRTYTQRYEYDEVGNIRTVRHVASGGGWTRTYGYAAASPLEPTRQSNRLTTTAVGNGGTHGETYGYLDAGGGDANGCITSINDMALVWDAKDQLRRVGLGGGGTAYYLYDFAGQRVRKVVDDQNGVRREERVYVGGYEVHRRFGAGALTRETVHVMDDKQRVALVETRTQPVTEAPRIRYQTADHLGSVALELDDTAGLITHETYHPYGTTSFLAGPSATEAGTKRYRYTGRERDEETGFGYHGARYYAPWLGRWVSPDPAGLVDGPNLYRYARDNPVRWNDPNGMEPPDRDASSIRVVPLLTDVDLTGAAGNFQLHDVFSSDRSVTGRGMLGARGRASFLLNVGSLGLSVPGLVDGSVTTAVDTDLGRAGARARVGLLVGDPQGLNLGVTGEGTFRMPIPNQVVLNQLVQNLVEGLPSGEGELRLQGAVGVGATGLATLQGRASLSDGTFRAELEARSALPVGRLELAATGRLGAQGSVSVESAQLRASVNLPGVGLSARATGTANGQGGLAVTGSGELRLPGGSLTAHGSGTVNGTSASFAGRFSGTGPLLSSYTAGSFSLDSQRGVGLNAGVVGLTYTPGLSLRDPAPAGSGPLTAGARSPWTPGGLTLGASFFQYSQGNLNYVSGGLMPDLSSRILTNPRVGIAAQFHF